VRKLVSETPAIFILFDCLMTIDRVSVPLTDRRAALEAFFDSAGQAAALKLTARSIKWNAKSGPRSWWRRRSIDHWCQAGDGDADLKITFLTD
jgi:ATP-dependent DNA ligase